MASHFGGLERSARILPALFGRERGFNRQVLAVPLYHDMTCEFKAGDMKYSPVMFERPPYTCRFGQAGGSTLVAVSDEAGRITLLDASRPWAASDERMHWPLDQFETHNNAVFDLGWLDGDRCLLTASGDQTLRLWDLETRTCMSSFSGHKASVKSVTTLADDPNWFASSGRDGNVITWDVRSAEVRVCPQTGIPARGAVHALPDAHVPTGEGISKSRKRTAGSKGFVVEDIKKTVSAVLSLRGGVLMATAGASDGVVKLWDMRRLAAPLLSITTPATGARSGRVYGILSLAQDALGSRLLVASVDASLYLYSVPAATAGPLATFTGHQASSFYIKAAMSPDGRYVASGSGDGFGYVWRVDRPQDAPAKLVGHAGEVSCIDFCPGDLRRLMTTSDDTTARLWVPMERKTGRPKVVCVPTTTVEPWKSARRTTLDAAAPARAPACPSGGKMAANGHSPLSARDLMITGKNSTDENDAVIGPATQQSPRRGAPTQADEAERLLSAGPLPLERATEKLTLVRKLPRDLLSYFQRPR